MLAAHMMKSQFHPITDAYPHISGRLESPLEETFALSAPKYFKPDVEATTQHECETTFGKFRTDFAFRHDGHTVFVECDGVTYHRLAQDIWRDAILLAECFADTIYRLRGKSGSWHLEDSLYVMSRWDPYLFSDRGKLALSRLAKEETIATINEQDAEAVQRNLPRTDINKRYAQIRYPIEDKEFEFGEFWVFRHLADDPILERYYDFAYHNRGTPLSEMDALYRSKRE